ncbi:MAG TPA: hypothetical protein ENN60_01140 [archaeon]|nr:hypothetical protein [archaeon]
MDQAKAGLTTIECRNSKGDVLEIPNITYANFLMGEVSRVTLKKDGATFAVIQVKGDTTRGEYAEVVFTTGSYDHDKVHATLRETGEAKKNKDLLDKKVEKLTTPQTLEYLVKTLHNDYNKSMPSDHKRAQTTQATEAFSQSRQT